MEPKDLRTLRRPLNVVAMKAPVSLRFVSEADIQRADYQPSDLGICAALGSYEGSAMPDPSRASGRWAENAKTPHGRTTIGQRGRQPASDIEIVIYSANWRQGPIQSVRRIIP